MFLFKLIALTQVADEIPALYTGVFSIGLVPASGVRETPQSIIARVSERNTRIKCAHNKDSCAKADSLLPPISFCAGTSRWGVSRTTSREHRSRQQGRRKFALVSETSKEAAFKISWDQVEKSDNRKLHCTEETSVSFHGASQSVTMHRERRQ